MPFSWDVPLPKDEPTEQPCVGCRCRITEDDELYECGRVARCAECQAIHVELGCPDCTPEPA